jgi:hypothetical protein
MPETPCKKAKVMKTGRSQNKTRKENADHSHMMQAGIKEKCLLLLP